MRKMMAVMLMGLAFAATQVEVGAQSRGKDARKPAATTNHSKSTVGDKRGQSGTTRPVRPDVKPGGTTKPGGSTKPSGPAVKPNGPTTKPGGPTNKPNGPAAKPNGPAAKPNGPANKPGGPAVKPGGPAQKPGYKPAPKPGYGSGHKPGYKPGYKPGHKPGYKPGHKPGYKPGYRPGYRPAPRPPRPPKPIIVVRPVYGSIIAAVVANQLVRSAVRASSRPVYYRVEANGLSLSHSYVAAGTEYYYQDGVFYIVDAYGQCLTIIPPTGALVEYLPEDYVRFKYGSETYFRVDDTVYALTLVDGTPYFEVLGQL